MFIPHERTVSSEVTLLKTVLYSNLPITPVVNGIEMYLSYGIEWELFLFLRCASTLVGHPPQAGAHTTSKIQILF